MSDIKLFRLSDSSVEAIPGSSMAIEKTLQNLIERHLDEFLGVRFLATEFSTTKSHGGRIDTLGIDEMNCPVIVEYKRAVNENVINQGLFYLNWLLEHRAEFKLLVMEKLSLAAANLIDWRYPRLICVASDFTKYDVQAIQQIPQNIDLVRYRRYGDDLLLLELAGHQTTMPENRGRTRTETGETEPSPVERETQDAVVPYGFDKCSAEVHAWNDSLRAFILALGDDVVERAMPSYFAYRHLKTFAYLSYSHTKNRITVEVLRLPDDPVPVEPGFIKKRSDYLLRIFVDSADDTQRAQEFIRAAYERG